MPARSRARAPRALRARAGLLDEVSGFVGFGPGDVELLRAVSARMQPHLPRMAEVFYSKIEENPRAEAVLREGPAQIRQLKKTLQRWAQTLFTLDRDELYAEMRRRVGIKHVELGLEHRYVLAAMGVLRTFFAERLQEILARSTARGPTLQALHRALDLDTNLITEAYFTSREARLLESRGAESTALRRIQALLVQGHHHLVNLDQVRQVLSRLVPVERLVIFLDRPADGAFQVHGLSGTVHVPEVATGARIPYEECPMTAVVRNGVSRTFELAPDEPLAMCRNLFAGGIRTVTVLPLWVEDAVIGTLNVATTAARPHAGDQDSLGFLQGIADAIAMAVARWEANLKLFDSEEQFRSLFEAVADGLFVVDSGERYRVVNQVFLGMVGRRSDQVIGKHVAEVHLPATARRILSIHSEVMRTGVPVVGQHALEVTGGLRWFSVSYSPVRTLAGDVVALTGIMRDVTQERERTAHQVHQHKMSSLGLLAAGIAHEVSNPLASIACIAEDLQETTTDDSARDLLRRIIVSTQRASRSLQQVLTFVRPSSRRGQRLSLNDIVEKTLDMSTFDPRARGHRFVRELTDPLPHVSGIGDDLSQVLLNLLLNAMDAMGKTPGAIRVRTWAEDDRVMLSVADSGPGIDPDKLPRIFEPFYTTKTEGRGTGLGLFVSSQVLRDHGGRLEVESVPGQGAVFTLSLPAAVAEGEGEGEDEGDHKPGPPPPGPWRP